MYSLWMIAGDERADRVERKLPGWIKIIGPVEWNLAFQVQTGLCEFLFEKNGILVFREMIAD